MSKLFAERLSSMMKKNKMNQKELALKIGVTEAAISRYIGGERDPKIDVVANMATALHTTTDYLLGREDADYVQTELGRIKMFVARNSLAMTKDQKRELIEVLLGED